MKTFWVIMIVFVLGIGARVHATEVAVGFEIEWVEPESYRDAVDAFNGGERSRQRVLTDLERYWTEEAQARIPEGYKLYMAVTELDLAGDFEPWHGASWNDVRVIKSIYPARVHFSYRVIDGNGEVAMEGDEELRDSNLVEDSRVSFLKNRENYPWVKVLVSEWMRKISRELRSAE